MGILIKSNFSGIKHACKQRIRSRRNGEVGILISYKISPKVAASPCPNTYEMFVAQIKNLKLTHLSWSRFSIMNHSEYLKCII